jgi:hypothetical protein
MVIEEIKPTTKGLIPPISFIVCRLVFKPTNDNHSVNLFGSKSDR